MTAAACARSPGPVFNYGRALWRNPHGRRAAAGRTHTSRSVGPEGPDAPIQVIRPPTDFIYQGDPMLNGLVSALFVVAGGACAVAGYMVGSWHQRRALDADLVGELFAADRGFDLLDEPRDRRDQRLN